MRWNEFGLPTYYSYGSDVSRDLYGNTFVTDCYYPTDENGYPSGLEGGFCTVTAYETDEWTSMQNGCDYDAFEEMEDLLLNLLGM